MSHRIALPRGVLVISLLGLRWASHAQDPVYTVVEAHREVEACLDEATQDCESDHDFAQAAGLAPFQAIVDARVSSGSESVCAQSSRLQAHAISAAGSVDAFHSGAHETHNRAFGRSLVDVSFRIDDPTGFTLTGALRTLTYNPSSWHCLASYELQELGGDVIVAGNVSGKGVLSVDEVGRLDPGDYRLIIVGECEIDRPGLGADLGAASFDLEFHTPDAAAKPLGQQRSVEAAAAFTGRSSRWDACDRRADSGVGYFWESAEMRGDLALADAEQVSDFGDDGFYVDSQCLANYTSASECDSAFMTGRSEFDALIEVVAPVELTLTGLLRAGGPDEFAGTARLTIRNESGDVIFDAVTSDANPSIDLDHRLALTPGRYRTLVSLELRDGRGGALSDSGSAAAYPVATVRALDLYLKPPHPGKAGQVNELTATQATPHSLVHFIYGWSSGRSRVPNCPTLTVDIGSAVLLGRAMADAKGVATIRSMVPMALTGRQLHLQAVEHSSCHKSNALEFTFQ